MSFVEVEFLFFLPLVFAAYWLGPRRRGWQNSVLLLAGYLFYASWHSKLLGLLVGYHAMQLPLLSRVQQGFFELPDVLRGAAYGAAVVALLILTPIGPGTFIYQQF